MSIHDPLWKYDRGTDVAATFRRHGFRPTTKAERERRQIERYGDRRGRIITEESLDDRSDNPGNNPRGNGGE